MDPADQGDHALPCRAILDGERVSRAIDLFRCEGMPRNLLRSGEAQRRLLAMQEPTIQNYMARNHRLASRNRPKTLIS